MSKCANLCFLVVKQIKQLQCSKVMKFMFHVISLHCSEFPKIWRIKLGDLAGLSDLHCMQCIVGFAVQFLSPGILQVLPQSPRCTATKPTLYCS